MHSSARDGVSLRQGHLSVIIGSRSVVGARSAELWCSGAISLWLASLPTGSTVMSGGAPGIDEMGVWAARISGIPTVEYKLDGRRWLNGVPAVGEKAWWSTDKPPSANTDRQAWRAWCLRRDDAVVAAVKAAVTAGWTYSVFGIVAPWPSSPKGRMTAGTDYTLQRFREADLKVVRLEVPADLNPHP